MVSLNLKALAKSGLCSNCSQKLDECSLARARKIFCYCSHARIFVKIPLWKNVLRNLTEKCTRYECFWKHIIHSRFADVLLKLTQVTILLERHPHSQSYKVTESRVMMTCGVLPINLQSLTVRDVRLQFALVTQRPYCPGRPKKLCFTTPSLAVKTVGRGLAW